jgi:hypothetical protein
MQRDTHFEQHVQSYLKNRHTEFVLFINSENNGKESASTIKENDFLSRKIYSLTSTLRTELHYLLKYTITL